MRFPYWLAAGFAVFSVVGCAPKDAGAGATAPVEKGGEKKNVRIAMIAKSSDNPVFTAARVGAEAAAKELSAEHGIAVTVDWLTPPKEDGQVQAQRIAQAVNDGANAVLISCSDAAKVTGAINDAVDRGVPVMTFDSDAPGSKRFAFFGTNDEEGGTKVMQEVVRVTGGKAKVAILAGNQNAPNLQKRRQGVLAEAAKHAGIKIVGTFYHGENPQDGTAEVRRAMAANPQIDAWAMVGGWPLFATGLMDLDPKKVKIVAFDALPQQLAYVENGVAPVLVAQPIYDWGYVSVKTIVDKVALGKDVPEVTNMKLENVTAETLPEWAAKLKDWGFEVDAKYLAKG